jgi:hypothetical protein
MYSIEALHRELGSRLDAILPPGFTISGDRHGLRVGSDDWASFGGGELQGETEAEILETVRGMSVALLNSVQDYVIVTIRDVWPDGPVRQPEPHARIDGGELRLWFGSEDVENLALKPIELSALRSV